MTEYWLFILAGYLSGSVLYGWVLPKIFWKVDTKKEGRDHNPGTANAFLLCGNLCGILVLLLELAKGFVPVYAAGRVLDPGRGLFALVLAAPVLGHAWPAFTCGRGGGKAIAVSFGVFMGLLMDTGPLRLLIFFYLFFSLIVEVNPHGLRTVLTYGCVAACGLFTMRFSPVLWGTLLIAGVVMERNWRSLSEEKPRVRLMPKLRRHPEAV